MLKLFLFFEKSAQEIGPSLGVDETGQIIEPLKHRTATEINQLSQAKIQIIIVLPSTLFTFHQLDMSWLPEKKARAAIPYALEERLAEPVEDLHFTFERNYYQNNQYCIAVCAQNLIREVIQHCTEKEIVYDYLTTDWFALHEDEIAILDQYLLVNTPQFKGSLTTDLGLLFFKDKHLDIKNIYFFNDSLIAFQNKATVLSNSLAKEWVAKRLNSNKTFNLCQGEFQKKDSLQTVKKWSFVSFIFILLWLISILITNLWELNFLHRETVKLDQQIALIYHQFFPQAKQVISPRFRINQLLQGAENKSGKSFWNVWFKFIENLPLKVIQVEQVNFQSPRLIVNLRANNFADIEQLEKNLTQSGLSVHQAQALNKDNQVYVSLELEV